MLIPLGQKIRKRRKELGLKVYELANKVQVNPVYITQIEKHNKLPSLEVMERIIKALNLNEDIIIDDYLKEKDPEKYEQYMASVTKSFEKFSEAMKPLNKAFAAIKAPSFDPKTSQALIKAYKEFQTTFNKTLKQAQKPKNKE
ncbi:MAG: helix-turn-helix transcriptional regulator [Candidatus Omnitrophica bacterium]|nr:helix-turn-helix transcriptional regulator [Candidatus Omnitrophota bacterium]